MATLNGDISALSPSEHQVQLRRAVIASTIGTAIEWYDFFLYSIVTGLVFAKLFFPHSDPWVGTLEAFGIYAVGFVARPIGAAIFGHYGDRIGRKSTLIATLLLMGLATFAVALVPTYERIGIWGAVILTVLLSALARMGEHAPFYIFTAFIFSYGTDALHVSRNFLLTAVLSASVLSFVSIPLFGHISDRIGRKNMYMIGAAVTVVFGFIYFAMLNTGSEKVIFLAVILSLIPHDMLYGPQAALIAESFTGRLRYSGSSLGYQLPSIIAGGPAPLIATWLYGTYHSAFAIAIYIAACAVITLVATALMTDYTRRDISGEYPSR